MAQEKFGPMGNERYRQYLGDIRGSGENLLALVDDLLELSNKIERRQARARFRLRVVQCPHPAMRRRRAAAGQSRAHHHPHLAVPQTAAILADARSVRQIVLNLISTWAKFTGAGGQVIVSTTLTDLGAVVLRVRDSGPGMSETEMALALEPFRQVASTAAAARPAPGSACRSPRRWPKPMAPPSASRARPTLAH